MEDALREYCVGREDGAEEERERIVAWLREYGNHEPMPNCVRCAIADAIDDKEHLEGIKNAR